MLPAYNEAHRLEQAVARLDAMVRDAGWDDVELLVSDDGSTDATAALVERIADRLPALRVIEAPTNRGKGAALAAGFAAATHDLVMFLDADVPVDAASLQRMVRAADGADLVLGTRRLPGATITAPQPWPRRLGGHAFRLAAGTLGYRLTSDPQCGIKLLDRTTMADVVARCASRRFAFDIELITRAQRRQRRIREVAVTWRHVPGSSLRPLRDAVVTLRDLIRLRRELIGPAVAASSGAPRVLVVTAAPDDRASTARLDTLISRLEARDDCHVELWYLRSFPEHRPRPRSRVVDDLRTWLPARLCSAVGAEPVAAALRGRRLRRWFDRLDPDAVVLDDGLGARVAPGGQLPSGRRRAVVVRRNPEPPALAEWETTWAGRPDVVVGGAAPDDPQTAWLTPIPVERFAVPPSADPDERRRRRADLGVPVDGPLVVGWGDDAWLDGPDLFVRALWALTHRHGVAAHGLWYGIDDDRERQRLVVEAERCGIGGAITFADTTGAPDPLDAVIGDAAFVSHRVPASTTADLRPLIATGLGIVEFGDDGPDPLHVGVAPLDVEAAATELARLLAADRTIAAFEARRRLDLDAWIDWLLSAVATAGRP